MLTPYFKVEQDNQFIIIHIQLKYVKIKEVDFCILENNFKFHLKPYFLNLFFSDNLKETENCSSQYDFEKGILICKVEKEVYGQEFKDIDKLSNLMDDKINNKTNNSNSSLINKKGDVIGVVSGDDDYEKKDKETEDKFAKLAISSDKSDESNKNNNIDKCIVELNRLVYEEICDQFKILSLNNQDRYTYGFNNEFSKVFDKREVSELFIFD